MRQLEEAENKLVVPQTWDTHQHTALDVGEASLPNCRASNNALQGSSNSTTEQEGTCKGPIDAIQGPRDALDEL
jgi:hypothetical protein